MFREIRFEDIDNNKIEGSYIIIDVRSPGEFKSETIPGAINIPLFNDDEREIIGTEYIQNSIDNAKKLGIEAASRKLPEIYEKVSELDKQYDNLVFFCARGGFRSRSLVCLFKSIGIDAIKLDGGYKGYRKYINENLPKIVEGINFVVLYGNTGTGKTDILKSLEEKGKDILDLEGCANHRGSLLGGVGLGSSHTQKMFEGLVYEALKNRKSNLVFTEGESKRIGRVVMPDFLFNTVKSGVNIKIEAEIDYRIENILRDYVDGTDEELIKAIDYLRGKLGDKNVERYNELILAHDYEPVIEELMIKYYDPLYEFKDREYLASFDNYDSEETADNIIEFFDRENNN